MADPQTPVVPMPRGSMSTDATFVAMSEIQPALGPSAEPRSSARRAFAAYRERAVSRRWERATYHQ